MAALKIMIVIGVVEDILEVATLVITHGFTVIVKGTAKGEILW
jgi:hypothetical protein